MAHPGTVMVPFIGLVPGGLHPGRKISINGMVLPTTNRFAINLQCGPNVNPRDDIALHMNFRYDQQVPYVVRNSLLMQQWGLEEGHGYLSFGRGQPFEVRIDVDHDHCKIFFNGLHFTDFKYRIPLQRVTYITVDGDVALHNIRVDGMDIATHGTPHTGVAMPPGHPGMMPPGGHPGMMPPGGHPGGHVYPGYPTHPPQSAAIPMAAMATGMAMGATMAHGHTGYVDKHSKKAMKKQQKAMKKAMKHHKPSHHKPSHHHKMHGHHGHHGSSSSSSSSSSEEE